MAVCLGASVNAQESTPGNGSSQPTATRSPNEGQGESSGSSTDDSSSDPPKEKPDRSLAGRFRALASQKEDPDGPINTDRPTFTPANTVVPKGRLQFESGFTFNSTKAGPTRAYVHDFPELAVRFGLTDRLEFRTFWLGQTYAPTRTVPGGPFHGINGPSDMEVGFKWQLFPGDETRKWIPTTALITSIMAPTGGTSLYSDQTVEPYINLIYGWALSKKLTLAGSTGYLGIRQQAAPGSGVHADNLQRYQQSLVAFYSATEKTTLFYEWYIYTFTNATDNRPQNFMDGGVIYRLSTNSQLDLRAGFGLSGRPDDFFTGAGLSFRF